MMEAQIDFVRLVRDFKPEAIAVGNGTGGRETEAFIQYIFPHRFSFSKYEIALASNVVSITAESGNIKRNYTDLIKPLMGGSEGKGRQLIETLETFVLDAGLSTAKTARIMEIHANTVQYRLKKIKEIIGVDISSPTKIPGLMIALSIARIERAAKISERNVRVR